MSKVTLAQLQFSVTPGDVRHNLDSALQLSEKALTSAQVDFLVLPEMWSTGFGSKRMIVDSIDSTTYILNKFRHLAMYYKVTIICGSLPDLRNGNLYNTSFVIDSTGEIIGNYSKNHLFLLTGEQTVFSPGTGPQVIATAKAKIGLAICFDLRFPELFRIYRKELVDIVFIPSQFPAPRLDHWITLNKARAIENQYYIVATNCIGQCGPFDCFGQSLVINPWGEVVSNAGETNGYIITTIDMKEIDSVREKLPCPID